MHRWILAHICMIGREDQHKQYQIKTWKQSYNYFMLLAVLKNIALEDVNALKTMFRVLSFGNANSFFSRNPAPCKVQAFSHSFLAKMFSINRQFPQILWKFAQNSAETVRFQNISTKLYGKIFISQGAIYIGAIFFTSVL